MGRPIQNVLTMDGRILITRSIEVGSPIVFDRAGLGTGLISETEPLDGRKELIDFYANGYVQKKTADKKGNLILTIAFDNTDVATSVYIEEIGVYARLQSDASNESVLFSYLTFGDYPSIILPADVQGMQRIFDLPFAFGTGNAVNVNITPSGMIGADEASHTAIPGKLLYVNEDGKIDASITGDAETLDGHDSSYFATADHIHDVATDEKNGFMSSEDKVTVDDLRGKVGQAVNRDSSPEFAGLTVNGIIAGARFV